MKRSLLLFFLFFSSASLFAQYDAECFNKTKEEIKKEVAELFKHPTDSVHWQDSMLTQSGMRYIDTVLYRYQYDANPIVKKIIGCKIPDFNFLTINKEEMSVGTISSEFMLICFSSTSYGDVCNARLHQYCRLKKLLKDSLTVINIFEDVDKKVSDYALNYENNVEFVANADVLTYNYGLGTGTVIYVLDKYKNIIYVKTGTEYRDTPDEIYPELLEKIRGTSCAD
jgi:hypothetical protein